MSDRWTVGMRGRRGRRGGRGRVPPLRVTGWLALVCMLVSPPVGRARAADADPWLGRDKALHYSISGAIAGAGYGGTALATTERSRRLLVGGAVALAAGVGKETLDAFGFGDPSFKDLAWDILGTATGLGVAWLIDWFVCR